MWSILFGLVLSMSFMPWRTLDYDDFLTSLHLINCCILFVQFCVVAVESWGRNPAAGAGKSTSLKHRGQKQRATTGYETIVQQLLEDKQERGDKLQVLKQQLAGWWAITPTTGGHQTGRISYWTQKVCSQPQIFRRKPSGIAQTLYKQPRRCFTATKTQTQGLPSLKKRISFKHLIVWNKSWTLWPRTKPPKRK